MNRRALLKTFGLAALPWPLGRIAAMTDVADYSMAERDITVSRATGAVLTWTIAADLTGYAVDFRIRDSRGDGASDLVTKSVGSGISLSVNSGVTTIAVTLTASNLTQTPGPYNYYMLPATGGVPNALYGEHGTFTIEAW